MNGSQGLSVEDLGDGAALAMFQDQLDAIVADVRDRPHVKGKRVATLFVTLEPVVTDGPSSEGEINTPQVCFTAKHATPASVGPVQMASFDKEGRLCVSAVDPNDPNQTVIE